MKEPRTPLSTLVFALILTLLSGVSYAASAAHLALSTSTMNFGNVVMGSTTQVVEGIRNSTASAINIASASIDGASFQVSNTTFPLTIAPGQEIYLAVIFSPHTAGSISGSLLISLDGTTPYVTVPLYGTGVIPGQMSANPASISFAAGSTSQRIAETVTNSGATTVVLQRAATTGSGFALTGPVLPLVLRPDQSATFTVYMPPSSTGSASGSINFSGLARWWTPGARGKYEAATTTASATSLVVSVSGTAAVVGKLTAAPSTVSFGNLQMGNTQNLPATLINSGAGPVTITQGTASGSGFGLSGLPLPTTLTPGESVTFVASFTPRSAGAAQGNILVVSNASNPAVNLALSGSANAPGQLALSPSSLNFGTVAIGKNQQLNATVTASGSSVTISSASVSNSEFSLGGMQLPVTIPAGQSASFTVTFAPQAAGATSASIDFGGTASTAVESVSGAGSAPVVQHSVALSWSPGGSTVTGYNIYRGTQTGGPYAKLNTTSSVANTYGDGGVNSGQTYFYVTTALDSAGAESTHSNEVQAIIP